MKKIIITIAIIVSTALSAQESSAIPSNESQLGTQLRCIYGKVKGQNEFMNFIKNDEFKSVSAITKIGKELYGEVKWTVDKELSGYRGKENISNAIAHFNKVLYGQFGTPTDDC